MRYIYIYICKICISVKTYKMIDSYGNATCSFSFCERVILQQYEDRWNVANIPKVTNMHNKVCLCKYIHNTNYIDSIPHQT